MNHRYSCLEWWKWMELMGHCNLFPLYHRSKPWYPGELHNSFRIHNIHIHLPWKNVFNALAHPEIRIKLDISSNKKKHIWLVVWTPLKNISQWLNGKDYPIYIHILWKIKNVWNHQPAIYSIYIHIFHSQKRLRSLPPRDLSMVWRQKCLGLRPAREIAPKKCWMKLHFMWFTDDLTNQNGDLLMI